MAHMKLDDQTNPPNLTDDLFKLIEGSSQGSGEKKGGLFLSFWKKPRIGRRSIEREFGHHALDGPSYSADSDPTESAETKSDDADDTWNVGRQEEGWGFNNDRSPVEESKNMACGFPPLPPGSAPRAAPLKGENSDSAHQRHLNPKVLVSRTPKTKKETIKRPKDFSLTQMISQSFDSEAGSEFSGNRRQERIEESSSVDDPTMPVCKPRAAEYAQLSLMGNTTKVIEPLTPYQVILEPSTTKFETGQVDEREPEETDPAETEDVRDTDIDSTIPSFRDRLAFYKTNSKRSLASADSESATKNNVNDDDVPSESAAAIGFSSPVNGTIPSEEIASRMHEEQPETSILSDKASSMKEVSVLDRIKKIQGDKVPASRPSFVAKDQAPISRPSFEAKGWRSASFSVAHTVSPASRRLSLSSQDSKSFSKVSEGTIVSSPKSGFPGKHAATRVSAGGHSVHSDATSKNPSPTVAATRFSFGEKRSKEIITTNMQTLAQRKASLLTSSESHGKVGPCATTRGVAAFKKSSEGAQAKNFPKVSLAGNLSAKNRVSAGPQCSSESNSTVPSSWKKRGSTEATKSGQESSIPQNKMNKFTPRASLETLVKPTSIKRCGVANEVEKVVGDLTSGQDPPDLVGRVKALRMSMECGTRAKQMSGSLGVSAVESGIVCDLLPKANSDQGQKPSDLVGKVKSLKTSMESGSKQTSVIISPLSVSGDKSRAHPKSGLSEPQKPMSLAERKKAFTTNVKGAPNDLTAKKLSMSKEEERKSWCSEARNETKREPFKKSVMGSSNKLSNAEELTPTATASPLLEQAVTKEPVGGDLRTFKCLGRKDGVALVKQPTSDIGARSSIADRKRAFMPQSLSEKLQTDGDESHCSQGGDTVSGVSTSGRVIILRKTDSLAQKNSASRAESSHSRDGSLSTTAFEPSAASEPIINGSKDPETLRNAGHSLSVADRMKAFVTPDESTGTKWSVPPQIPGHLANVPPKTKAAASCAPRAEQPTTSLGERKKAFEVNLNTSVDARSAPRRSFSLPKTTPVHAPSRNSIASISGTSFTTVPGKSTLPKAKSVAIADQHVNETSKVAQVTNESFLSVSDRAHALRSSFASKGTIAGTKTALSDQGVESHSAAAKEDQAFTRKVICAGHPMSPLFELEETKKDSQEQDVKPANERESEGKEDFASKLHFFKTQSPVVTKTKVSRPLPKPVLDDPSVASTRLETTSLGDYTIGGHPIYVLVDDNCNPSECLSPSPQMSERKIVCGSEAYFEHFDDPYIQSNEEGEGRISSPPVEEKDEDVSTEERYIAVKSRFSQKALPWRQQNAAGRYLERKRHTIAVVSETPGDRVGIKLPPRTTDLFCPISQSPVVDGTLLERGTENVPTTVNTPLKEELNSSGFMATYGTPVRGYSYGKESTPM